MLSKNKILLSVTVSALSLSVASMARANITDDFLLDIPLSEASMIGSHNTYNTSAWGYIDPNHQLRIEEQLENVRFIEYDVVADGNEIRLCHKYCSSGNKTLKEGLDKLNGFLAKPEYKNRVIILYLEDQTNDHTRLEQHLYGKIGNHIYKPTPSSCEAVPDTLTPRQVIDAEKRVVIWKDNHDRDDNSSGCSKHAPLRSLVFKDLGGISRFNEDRTNLTNFGRSTKETNPINLHAEAVVRELEKGTNFVNLDNLGKDARADKRLLPWNWAEGYPKTGQCAKTDKKGKGDGNMWVSANCSQNLRFACQDRSTKAWKITLTSGYWSEGEQQCEEEFGRNYFFSVPHNAQDNVLLSKVGSDAWLNYTSTITGKWEPVHHSYKLPQVAVAKLPTDPVAKLPTKPSTVIYVPKSINVFNVLNCVSDISSEPDENGVIDCTNRLLGTQFDKPKATSTNWGKLPGCATDIDVAPSGVAWVIGCDRSISRSTGNPWQVVPGVGDRIAVDNAGIPWHINSENGSIWKGNDANGSGWKKLQGCAKDIGVGPSGQAWIIDCNTEDGGNNSIKRWTGNSWEQIAGGATKISVDDAGIPWLVNKDGNTYRAKNSEGKGGWEKLSESAAFCANDIAAGPSGQVQLLECEDNGSRKIREWIGIGWRVIPEKGARVAIGPNGSRWIIRKGEIFKSQ